uniref:Phosphatidic acid phosphatase type 2/haloperoxidase domain-containing protein n=2 Tax=Clastoptera arizonana TaxID=38151 RepID=A0A1B6E2M5_9HEMI
MQRNWKELLASDMSDELDMPPPQGKTLSFVALFFETLGIMVVAIGAIYLRFFPVAPTNFIPSVWITSCSDTRYNRGKGSQEYVPLFYAASLAIPLTLILIGELENCSFPKNYRDKELTVGERIVSGIPRFGRLSGLYIIGVLLTSLCVDYTKLLVSSPRPYILWEYPSICNNLTAPFTSDIFVMQSFPSHISAIVAYCCLFSVRFCYISKLYGNTPTLLIIATQCFLFLIITSAVDRYSNNYSHIEDIVVGLSIGVFFAFYLCHHISLSVRVRDELNFPPLDIIHHRVLPRVSLPPVTEAINHGRMLGPQQQRQKNSAY